MKQSTIFLFFWSCIKPYKWWYLLTLPAPIFSGIFSTIQNLVFKMFVDLFAKNNVLTCKTLSSPIFIFIFLVLFNRITWTIRDIAYTQSQPFIRGEITSKAYKKVQNYSYNFFQNTPSGSVVSKIKSIVQGYDNMFDAIFNNILTYSITTFVSIFCCYFLNVKIFFILLIWAIIFAVIMIKAALITNKISKEESDDKHQMIGFVADNIANIFTLFSFATKQREFNKIDNFIKENSVKKDKQGNKIYTINTIIASFLYSAVLFVVMFYLIDLKIYNRITSGDFIFILMSVFRLGDSVWRLVNEIAKFIRQLGDFKSALSILEVPNQQTIDKKDARVLIV